MRIVIVGGVAGGMSAATRARRMNEAAEIIVLERNGFVSFANCGLPYYIGGKIEEEEKLLLTGPIQLASRFRIDARVGHEVLAIDRAARKVQVKAGDQLYWLPYDKLILATGANPILPKVDPQLRNVFVLRSVEDTRAIKEYLSVHQPKRALIAGAGFIGLEMAESLHGLGLSLTIVERSPHVLAPMDFEMSAAVDRTLRQHGIRVFTNVAIDEIRSASTGATAAGHLAAVHLADGRLEEADLVIVSIGVRPNVGLASAAGLTIGKSGGVSVDDFQRTSDPDIYAVGDMTEVHHGVTDGVLRIPLAGPANRQGRLAGEHAATGQSAPAGRPLGTAIVQVFTTNAAMTGLSERAAKAAGFDCDTAYAYPNHHAGYYPGAQPMRLKLVYEKGSGRLLGAQAVGGAGVDKRMDVVATVLHFRGTLEDLAALDLSYAPQFGSAKDGLHITSFVAMNQETGLTPAIAPWELSALDAVQLVDVRTHAEFAEGALPGAIHIPVDELRQRQHQLDPAKPTVVYCQVGQRGHVAARLLQQAGFGQVWNLKGGYGLAELVGANRP